MNQERKGRSEKRFSRTIIHQPINSDKAYRQSVGLGRPSYLMIGFIGPVIHNL